MVLYGKISANHCIDFVTIYCFVLRAAIFFPFSWNKFSFQFLFELTKRYLLLKLRRFVYILVLKLWS